MISVFLSTFAEIIFDPSTLALGFFATLAGIVLGALPGISSTMALAVLLPFSFAMSSTHAMVFLMGVFYGSVYGGSIPAILINIPGTPGSMVTQLDGYPLTKAGRGGEALMYSLVASTFGGIVGWLALVTLAPVLAAAAYSFQSPEYAVVMVFGLAMLAYSSPGSTFLGIIAGVFGLLIGTVGLDMVTNISRLDFGVRSLEGGLNLIPLTVGLFGFAEVLRLLEHKKNDAANVGALGRMFPSIKALASKTGTALRASGIAIIVGVIPAAGSAVAVAVAYAQEKKLFDKREKFGDGNPRGVVAAETGNNTCVGSALVPMMTLGIPGDTMTAVLVGALLVHGLRPGPELFEQNPEFVSVVYVALALSIVATFVLALPLMRIFARVMRVPARLLLFTIVLMCVAGSYSVQNSMFDVLLMVVFGVIGYLMGKVGIPTAPIMFGLVLGPLLEENVRRSLIVYGDWFIFIERPISASLLAVSAFVLFAPIVMATIRLVRRKI